MNRQQAKNEAPQQDRVDYGILLTIMLLGLIGMGAIYMAVANDSTQGAAIKAVVMQVVWYAVGGVGVLLIMRFDAEQLWRIEPILFGIGIFLLVAVLIFYNRQIAFKTGAKSWFKVGPITFQPSEVMKPAYILMLSRVVTLHNSKMPHNFANDWLLIGKMLLWTLPVAALLIAQHDLGTTLVFLAIFAGWFWFRGSRGASSRQLAGAPSSSAAQHCIWPRKPGGNTCSNTSALRPTSSPAFSRG